MSPKHKTDIVSGPLTPVGIDKIERKLEVTLADESLNQSEATLLFINEENLSRSPLVEILLERHMKVKAILDSGSDANLLAQSIYDKLVNQV
jgi:hypothetical protein